MPILALVMCAGPAMAEEATAPSPARDDSLRTVIFGGIDGGASTFASAGFKRTLVGPLDRDGPAVLASVGYGAYFERRPAPGEARPLHQTAVGAALGGYQWMLPWGAVGAFIGPEVAYETVRGRPDREGPRLGLRGQAELWAHPTADTLVTGTAILGSARSDLWARVALGYRVWDKVFAGPEVAAYATSTYRKEQFGVHLTGFEVSGVALRLSSGWQRESEDRRAGPYIGLSGYFRL